MTVVRDHEGVILMAAMLRRETDQLRRLYQDADRTQEAFRVSLASIIQQATRKFETSGRRHTLYLDSEMPSTLLPRYSNFRFAVIWSLKDTIRGRKFETRGNVFLTVRT